MLGFSIRLIVLDQLDCAEIVNAKRSRWKLYMNQLHQQIAMDVLTICDADTNSASQVDVATIVCFDERQTTGATQQYQMSRRGPTRVSAASEISIAVSNQLYLLLLDTRDSIVNLTNQIPHNTFERVPVN